MYCIFFFSSRRRHTRSLRDWSSDVCSSDLPSSTCGPESSRSTKASVRPCRPRGSVRAFRCHRASSGSPRSAEREDEMGRVIVMNGITLDGVMQAPGRPDEDTRDGFPYGGWAVPYADDTAVAKMGERMGEDRAFLF